MDNWTIEDFQKEIEIANHEEKKELLIRFIDNFDVFENKDMLLKYRAELIDVKEQFKIDDDRKCREDIKQGKVKLHKCIKSIKNYKEGNEYYVKIFDKIELKDNSNEIDNYLSKENIFIIRESKGLYISSKFIVDEDNVIEKFNEHFVLV